MTFEQIMTELKRKQYRPVYFLMGEEPYFIDVIADYIAENALPEQEKAFNQAVMYGKDATVYAVLDAAKRFPMMSQHQVVIVKEAQNLKDIDKLQFYVEKPLQSTILVISHKYKLLDKRLKLYKILDKSKDAAVFESKKLRDYQLPDWITAYLTERGYAIVPAAANLLTEYLGAELGKVTNELNKLMITLPVNEKKVTLEHIEANIGISKDYNVFELQNALGGKDVLKANRIIDYFARNPGSNPMVMVIMSLYSYFVKILTYHYLPDKSQAAAALKIPPFYVKDYVAAARKYPAPKIIQIISTLREYDLKSKGVGNSSASAGDLMREMTFRILH
ncbi:MAG: DNA polymerase III subunit delta [Bacteroidales bacterium]|jgi:DNA polymerase-3 subunit delta|nr:DNA polymerase III subunit delta [Bacteroidales bacterium]